MWIPSPGSLRAPHPGQPVASPKSPSELTHLRAKLALNPRLTERKRDARSAKETIVSLEKKKQACAGSHSNVVIQVFEAERVMMEADAFTGEERLHGCGTVLHRRIWKWRAEP